MPQITNTSKVNQDFVVGGTQDSPEIKTLRPGETDDLNVHPDDPHFKARVAAGELKVGANKTEQKKAAAAAGAPQA